MTSWVFSDGHTHRCIVWQDTRGHWHIEDNTGHIIAIYPTRDLAMTAAEALFTPDTEDPS